MADSSNSNAGSQSTESQTSTSSNESTTNSNGNFSGGLPGLGGESWGSFTSNGGWGPSSETEAAHSSGVQGPGLASGDFGTSWSSNGNSGSGSGDYTYNNTSYSNNKSEPVMTVDEVYGKGNQSIVESQGDYNATSNEKSNVETSTFGKQDTVSVTPQSIVEDKGLVDNAAIDSIEGLNFQQKDKESQDVLEAKKNRDEAEAEDKANQMRESLKAKTDETVDEKAINKFQIGNDDIENLYTRVSEEKAQDLQSKSEALTQKANDMKDADAKLSAAEAKQNELLAEYKAATTDEERTKVSTELQYVNKVKDEAELAYNNALKEQKDAKDAYDKALREYDNLAATKDAFRDAVNWVKDAYEKGEMSASEAVTRLQNMTLMADYSPLNLKTADMVYLAGGLDGKYLAANPSALQERYVGAEEAPAVTPESKAITAENTVSETKQTFENAIKNAAEKGADEQTVQAMTDIATSIDEAQTTMKQAIEQNDIPTYIEAQKDYNKNLEDALKIGNRLTQTDFNKDFVEAVAKANDFEVTLADGTKTTYSQFAADMATKSPEIAQAMYNAKADRLEAEGHNILAKIERAKSEMVGTWLGSKLTQADNQVRNQFNQMAKTNMRATYAAYNNVLSDPKATPEAKAEASAAINQANGLMTASAALQASTGFLSGIGDSMKDGVYGTTDPAALNAYQKTLNAIDNFAKITLGLGVTPGANKAYQNMYYMAGAKVNESGLFSRDFDSDGFALCQEYGNNAAAGMIAGAGELATGVALFFNPSTAGMGLNLVIDSIQTFTNGLYGVQKDARKSEKYTSEVVSYFNEAKDIAEQSGNKEAVQSISDAITQIENFELKSDEVGNLDNWLEGSGSNTATNEKFNQSLSYDEWLKLIEADPTMRDYAKKLIAEKKEK